MFFLAKGLDEGHAGAGNGAPDTKRVAGADWVSSEMLVALARNPGVGDGGEPGGVSGDVVNGAANTGAGLGDGVLPLSTGQALTHRGTSPSRHAGAGGRQLGGSLRP